MGSSTPSAHTGRVDDGAVRPLCVAGSRFRRARPRSEAALDRALRGIAHDRATGAQGLATATLRALTRASRRWRSLAPRELRAHAQQVAQLLESTQPAMGIFRRWAIEWRRFAREPPSPSLGRHLDRWAARWRAQLYHEMPRLLRVVRRRFPPHARVLTISRSASVHRALTGLSRSRRPREVIVLESRPGAEGRLLARDLRRSGLTVRLVPDAEGPRWVREVDGMIIGADTIYSDGSVAHKVGTRPLALAAHREGVPVLVVSGLSKAVAQKPSAYRLPPLFDVTPARAIAEYWTDRGVRKGGRWRGVALPPPAKLSRTPA